MKNKLFKLLIILIFFSFLCSYIVSTSFYTEYSANKKMIITSKEMKEFEEAIKNNEDIDELELLNKLDINYTNKFSNLMYDINNKGDKLFKKYLKKIFKFIGNYMLGD